MRHYTGGGFGWFDPKTGKLDGIWQPLSGYAVQWITPVSDGRFIAISTIRAPDELNNNKPPEEAKLFVFDVGTQKIVREIIPAPKLRTTGLIKEAGLGRLLGLTINPVGLHWRNRCNPIKPSHALPHTIVDVLARIAHVAARIGR